MRTDVPLIPVAFERRMDSPIWDILVPRVENTFGYKQRLFTDTKKWCNDCEAWLPVEQFWKDNTNPRGYRTFCKAHEKARKQRYLERKRAA